MSMYGNIFNSSPPALPVPFLHLFLGSYFLRSISLQPLKRARYICERVREKKRDESMYCIVCVCAKQAYVCIDVCFCIFHSTREVWVLRLGSLASRWDWQLVRLVNCLLLIQAITVFKFFIECAFRECFSLRLCFWEWLWPCLWMKKWNVTQRRTARKCAHIYISTNWSWQCLAQTKWWARRTANTLLGIFRRAAPSKRRHFCLSEHHNDCCIGFQYISIYKLGSYQ